jgi:hypothetical protein
MEVVKSKSRNRLDVLERPHEVATSHMLSDLENLVGQRRLQACLFPYFKMKLLINIFFPLILLFFIV